jgi:hypothetical protein
MQAIFERGGLETYERGLTLLKRRFAPNPRGPQLGRFDAAVLAQTPFRASRAVRPTRHGSWMWMFLAIGVGVLLAVNVLLVVTLAVANRHVELDDELGE